MTRLAWPLCFVGAVALGACSVYDPALLSRDASAGLDARVDVASDAVVVDAPRDDVFGDVLRDAPIIEPDVEEPTDVIVRLPDAESDGCACAPGEACCGARCASLARDPANCGECGNACPGTTCSTGSCTATCLLSFGDCDMNAANGCETNLGTSMAHCGMCGRSCSLPNAESSCTTGTCQLVRCNMGFANCDMMVANGCETDLRTVAHCGACNNRCAPPTGTPDCSTGVCGSTNCAMGLGNCDGNTMNGCETNLATSAANCGACGRACALPNATASCSAGACAIASCNAGFGNCDGNATNGCETNLSTSTTHCGGCGRLCAPSNATASCTMGTCGIASCRAGFANCDGALATGCEVDTNTNATHCGMCGRACVLPNASARCTAGACGINVCNAGFGNCDGNAANGCETATSTSSTNCGACGRACPAGTMCVAGVCDSQTPVQIETSYRHVCVRRTAGTMACWGYNQYGQLGDSSTVSSSVPVTATTIADALSIAVGSRHTCARRSTTVQCWGYNQYGQLGNGLTTTSPAPVTVTGLGATQMVAAGLYHTCAVRSAGDVACWGYNVYGQLGNNTMVNAPAPVTVTGLSNVTQVAGGYYHTCARRSTSAVSCWGYNAYGQLGNNTTTNTMTPVTVSGITDAVQIVAGQYHTCARRSSGAVSCWGRNSSGQLGNATLDDSMVPVAVFGLTDATHIAAGYLHTCARRASGAVVCWGNNSSGQNGDGTTAVSTLPSTVTGLSDALDVTTGGTHSCARRANRTVVCWGDNGVGQLGNGMMTGSLTPTPVLGL